MEPGIVRYRARPTGSGWWEVVDLASKPPHVVCHCPDYVAAKTIARALNKTEGREDA